MPSAMNQMMLKEVKSAVGNAQALILVDPSKLKSGESLKLRKDLRGVGAKLKVAKVSLLRRAVPEQAASLCDGTRSSIGVVVCSDMVAAAKVVADLAKEEKLAVRGGLMDGQAVDAATVKRISELPSKQQLYGMLVNMLAAPLTAFVRVISEIEKKQRPPEAPAPVPAPTAA